LIFFPEESRSIAVLSSAPDEESDRCAFKDATFVFTTKLITELLNQDLESYVYGFSHDDPAWVARPLAPTTLRNYSLLQATLCLHCKRHDFAAYNMGIGRVLENFRKKCNFFKIYLLLER
tara:strand:- start:12 stop:371 length:360 start_codon:yes stop_codon:yes gene_type:complete